MNRHLKIAFFMAPLLAIGTYALTGRLISPKEIESQQGQLRLLGKCQPTDNSCIYILGSLEVKLISNEQQSQQQLALISNEAISGLSVALGENNEFKQFPMMKSDDNKYWQLKLTKDDNILKYNDIRLAFSKGKNTYFAESKVMF